MAECTATERQLLDTLAKGNRDLDLEARYNVECALQKAPEFFEKAVRARMQMMEAQKAWASIESQFEPLGLSGGRIGGIALFWDMVAAEAAERCSK